MPDLIAIILGSGCSDFNAGASPRFVETAYGAPSGAVYERSIGGRRVLALARHGDGHTIPPHAINYRANIAALERSGARAIVALNTVGAITAIRDGGQIALPDQLIDYTWGREHTYFDATDTAPEHIDFTEPFSAALRKRLLEAAAVANVDCHDGGVYAATQGPRLETAAEIDRLERDGADFVGMTAMPEAALAAELGVAYACLAMVVNQAAGRSDRPIHDDVAANSQTAKTRAIAVIEALAAMPERE